MCVYYCVSVYVRTVMLPTLLSVAVCFLYTCSQVLLCGRLTQWTSQRFFSSQGAVSIYTTWMWQRSSFYTFYNSTLCIALPPLFCHSRGTLLIAHHQSVSQSESIKVVCLTENCPQYKIKWLTQLLCCSTLLWGGSYWGLCGTGWGWGLCSAAGW